MGISATRHLYSIHRSNDKQDPDKSNIIRICGRTSKKHTTGIPSISSRIYTSFIHSSALGLFCMKAASMQEKFLSATTSINVHEKCNSSGDGRSIYYIKSQYSHARNCIERRPQAGTSSMTQYPALLSCNGESSPEHKLCKEQGQIQKPLD